MAAQKNNLTTKDELIKNLFDVKSIKTTEKTPLKVGNALYAPLRLDIRELMSSPKTREAVVDSMIEAIKKNFSKYDAVGGLSPVGIPLTYLIANKMKLPMIYARSKEVSNIDGRFSVEGVIKENEKVIIIGNEVRTGQKLIDAVTILKKRGVNIVGCLTIVDYNIEGTKKKFDDLGIKLVPLFELKDILKVGVDNKYINDAQLKQIKEWNKDVYKWMDSEKKRINDRINEIKNNVIEIFINLGLIEFHLDMPLKFKNGVYSPVYIDTKKLLSFPAERDYVYQNMLDIAINNIDFNNVDTIVGEASSGIAPATWIARKLEKPMIYIRDDDEEDVDEDLIEGKINNGDTVLLIDDVLGTGIGTMNAINKIQKFGANLRNMLCIVDYGIPHTKQILGYENVSVQCVITLSDLLNASENQGTITQETKEQVLEWLSDPYEWTERINQGKKNKKLK